jgi:N-acetylneuraminic acid mutarotase
MKLALPEANHNPFIITESVATMNMIYFWFIGTFITIFGCLFLSSFTLSSGTPTVKTSIEEEKHSWTNGSPMPTARTEISAALLDDKIYVVAGQTKQELTNIVEVYDPVSDKWSNDVAPLPIALDHSAMAAYNGKLYLVGGFLEAQEGEDKPPTNLLFIYDPVINKWLEGEPMPTARGGLVAHFINGTLYAVGGSLTDRTDPLNLNEAYNPATNTWEERSPMPTPRHHMTSEVVDGKLYVVGGRETRVPSSLNVNEMYDPENDRWIMLEPMSSERSSIAAGSFGDGYIYVFGGEKEEGSFNKNERYNVEANKWTQDISMPTPRLGLEAVQYKDKIYVIGGKESQPNSSATDVNEIFRTNTSQIK